MTKYALLLVALAACADEASPPVADHATAPVADISGVGECAPVVSPCPPWWLSCSALQLRQSECRTACETRTCAGFDAGECFNDCVAYRYEAYCPTP